MVPMSTYKSKMCKPPEEMGACLASVGKNLETPDSWRPAANAGAMMCLHSSSEKVAVVIAYFIFAEIVVCSAVHAILGVDRPK